MPSKNCCRTTGSRPSRCDGRTLTVRQSQSELEQSQAAEIARLKRKLAEQEEELAIVKKAATYFAKSLR